MAERACSLELASICYEGFVHVIIASVQVFTLPVFQLVGTGIKSVSNKDCFGDD